MVEVPQGDVSQDFITGALDRLAKATSKEDTDEWLARRV